MRRGIHELSEAEKRQVADELMLQGGVFGTIFTAALLLLLVFVWSPSTFFTAASRVTTAIVATR